MQIARKNAIKTLLVGIIYCLTALAGINAFGIRGVFLLLLLGLLFLRQLFLKRISVNEVVISTLFFFLLFIVTTFLFKPFSLLNLLLWFVLPFGFFLVGSSLKEEESVHILNLLGLFSLCYVFSATINLFFSISQGATTTEGIGLMPYQDIWGKAATARTLYSIDLIPFLGFAVPMVICPPLKRKALFRIIASLLLLWTIGSTVFVGNRSYLLIVPMIVGFSVLFWGYKQRGKKAKIVTTATVAAVIVSLSAFFVCFYLNAFGLQDFLIRFPVFKRILEGGSNANRNYQYSCYWSNWLNYPFGGLSASGLIKDWNGGPEAVVEIHNVYLQVYSFAGWPSFILMSILIVWLLIMLFRTKATATNKHLYFCSAAMLASLIAIFFFEPLITSEPFLMALFFFLAGVLLSLYKRQRIGFFAKTIGFAKLEQANMKMPLLEIIVIFASVLLGSMIIIFLRSVAFGSLLSVALSILAFQTTHQAKQKPTESLWKDFAVFLFIFGCSLLFDLVAKGDESTILLIAEFLVSWALFLLIRLSLASKGDGDSFFFLREWSTEFVSALTESQSRGEL